MSETLSYPFENAGPIEPPPQWAELRERCPVAKVRLGGGAEAHLLTRYDDVRSLLSDDRFERNVPDGAASRADVGVLAEGSDIVSAVADKESHLAWRRLLQATFTAKRVQALVPAMTAKAEELLDAMLAFRGDAVFSVLSPLADAKPPGLTAGMMVGTTIALLVAGHETTASH